jgi:hypothetical protein
MAAPPVASAASRKSSRSAAAAGPRWGKNGVTLARTMQVGPCIPVVTQL